MKQWEGAVSTATVGSPPTPSGGPGVFSGDREERTQKGGMQGGTKTLGKKKHVCIGKKPGRRVGKIAGGSVPRDGVENGKTSTGPKVSWYDWSGRGGRGSCVRK